MCLLRTKWQAPSLVQSWMPPNTCVTLHPSIDAKSATFDLTLTSNRALSGICDQISRKTRDQIGFRP